MILINAGGNSGVKLSNSRLAVLMTTPGERSDDDVYVDVDDDGDGDGDDDGPHQEGRLLSWGGEEGVCS